MAVDYSKLFNTYTPSYTHNELSYINDPIYGEIKVPDGFKLIQDQEGRNMLWADDLVIKPETTEKPMKEEINWRNAPEEDNRKPTQSQYGTSVKGDKRYAFNFFYDKFYNLNKQKLDDRQASEMARIQSAGVVGNLILESEGLNTKAKGDGGKAIGLAQWHPDRQVGLKALANSRGVDISDFDTQLEYVWQELNSTEKSALKSLSNVKTVSEATTNFMKNFERPNSDPKINKLSQRIKYAESLLV